MEINRTDVLYMKALFRMLVLTAWFAALFAACKSGLPSPQEALGASAQLISISPKATAPAQAAELDLSSGSKADIPTLQGHISY